MRAVEHLPVDEPREAAEDRALGGEEVAQIREGDVAPPRRCRRARCRVQGRSAASVIRASTTRSRFEREAVRRVIDGPRAASAIPGRCSPSRVGAARLRTPMVDQPASSPARRLPPATASRIRPLESPVRLRHQNRRAAAVVPPGEVTFSAQGLGRQVALAQQFARRPVIVARASRRATSAGRPAAAPAAARHSAR